MLAKGTTVARPIDPIFWVGAKRPRLSIARIPGEMAGRRSGLPGVAPLMRPNRAIYRPVVVAASAGGTYRLAPSGGSGAAPAWLHARERGRRNDSDRPLRTLSGPLARSIDSYRPIPLRVMRSIERTTGATSLRTDAPATTPIVTNVRSASERQVVAATVPTTQPARISPLMPGTGGRKRRVADGRVGRPVPASAAQNSPTKIASARDQLASRQAPTADRPGPTADYMQSYRPLAPQSANIPRTAIVPKGSGSVDWADRPSQGSPVGHSQFPDQLETAEVHLDGQVLGQWMLDHIEHALTQAPTTANFVTNHGIPAWPGQPPLF